jgi:hypothetical protein
VGDSGLAVGVLPPAVATKESIEPFVAKTPDLDAGGWMKAAGLAFRQQSRRRNFDPSSSLIGRE